MVHVIFTGNFRNFTAGDKEAYVDARNIVQLFGELGRRYPELAPHLEEGAAVAVDGVIFQDALYKDLAADSEVHLMPAIAAG